MITLYHNSMTRSLRSLWLLEELGLHYIIRYVEFVPPPPGKIFAQATPTGRFPTLTDGEIVLCESGAIAEYLVERYGQGQLAPPPGSSQRGAYLQWMHFPEGTLNPYINAIQRFKSTSPAIATNLSDELDLALGFVNRTLTDQLYIVGNDFTAADIMLAVSLLSINQLGLLTEQHPLIAGYLRRLQPRPALANALQH